MKVDAVSRARLRLRSDQRQWRRMLGFSFLVHATLLVAATLWPGLFAAKPPPAPVYSVELVSLPAPKSENQWQAARLREGVGERAIPLSRFEARGRPLSLKKRQGPVLPSRGGGETELLEKTLAGLERRPKSSPAPEKASGETPPPKAAKKVSLVNIGGMKGEELSQALGLYRALIYDRIESNWALPEHRVPEKRELEAVVVVRARRDGTLSDIHFEKKSGDAYFDESVMKAILKSKPFPPFPDIYSPKEEEIVIRFSPSGRS